MRKRRSDRSLAYCFVGVIAVILFISVAINMAHKPSALDNCKQDLAVSLATGHDSLNAAYRASSACMSLTGALRTIAAREAIAGS